MSTGIDFETFGGVNLPKKGLDRYINDDSFTPLMLSAAQSKSSPRTFDFVFDGKDAVDACRDLLHDLYRWNAKLVAHNVGFERAVMRQMGFPLDWLTNMVDSAVIARSQGAASHLEAAAPQLTNIDKLEVGKELIQLFSIPNEWNRGQAPTKMLIEESIETYEKWQLFKKYCEIDAAASNAIYRTYKDAFGTMNEFEYEWCTYEMNQAGWPVDLNIVKEMQLRYEYNVQQAVEAFRKRWPDTPDTFFNSSLQLKEWCYERGVKLESFDADHVDQYLKVIGKKLNTLPIDDPKGAGYSDVYDMLKTKKEIGGSSLKKLYTILDTIGADGRLRNQYMHLGAGQSYRTTGKGVQMQNLKRLGMNQIEMEDLYDASLEMDNDTLGENLRQVFVSSDLQGKLAVGDFSSVESRALAYLAGEEWKLDSYRQGKDVYKVLAAKFAGITYDEVTKEARAEGKYSELSCGYQSGPQVLKDFMHRLGFDIPLDGAGGAGERVNNWREANPNIVLLWQTIQEALDEALLVGESRRDLAHDLELVFDSPGTPPSLAKQHPGAWTLRMSLYSKRLGHHKILERVFQGCYRRGGGICYYKPSDTKSGPLWKAFVNDPKTNTPYFYHLYGGKVTGILTQSFCRELFFYSLKGLRDALTNWDNATIVGQFHDEIVVDWTPATQVNHLNLQALKAIMGREMSNTWAFLHDFPLTADIKDDYRYTK